MTLIPVETDARGLFLSMAKSIKTAAQNPGSVLAQIAAGQSVEFSRFNSEAMIAMSDANGNTCQAQRPHEETEIIFCVTNAQKKEIGRIRINPKSPMASVNSSGKFGQFRGILHAALEG